MTPSGDCEAEPLNDEPSFEISTTLLLRSLPRMTQG